MIDGTFKPYLRKHPLRVWWATKKLRLRIWVVTQFGRKTMANTKVAVWITPEGKWQADIWADLVVPTEPTLDHPVLIAEYGAWGQLIQVDLYTADGSTISLGNGACLSWRSYEDPVRELCMSGGRKGIESSKPASMASQEFYLR